MADARSYRYQIRELATGVARIHAFANPNGTRRTYWWLEGNFGCDCNRRLQWLRAAGECDEDRVGDEDDGCPCNTGPNAYVFDWVELDGVRFIENDKPTENAE